MVPWELRLDLLLFYFCSANLEKVKVHPNLYSLTVQLLARGERYAELGLFVLNKVSKSRVFYDVCLSTNKMPSAHCVM